MDQNENFVSLKGPVEKVDGKLVLRIPLVAGGEELVDCSRGIASVEGDYLVVTIPDWLAKKIGIGEGSWVHVDNHDGKFGIQAAPETDEPIN